MKKIKQKLSTIRSALSVKTHKMPRVFIILMMLGVNVLILLIAAFIALIIDDGFNSYIEALALGSITWLLAPNAILAIENTQTLFLAVFVLLIGIILFSGTIIALITNGLKDYFERKQNSSGKVYLQNHIVVLNYNNKVPELVADLLYVKSRKITVLVLADVNKHMVEEKIKSALLSKNVKKDKLKQFNVLIKKGDPLNYSELNDASLPAAETIIIMNDQRFETNEGVMTAGDLNVIKIILTLAKLSFKASPTIVSEVKAFDSKEKILTLRNKVHALKNHKLIPVCFDRRLGQIMAQTIMQKHTEDVYLSMFSFEGAEVYPVENSDFETCLHTFTHAIPLEQTKDHMFALSDTYHHAQLRTTKRFIEPIELSLKPLNEKHRQSILIVGSNNKLSYIKETFFAYENLHGSDFSIQHITHDAIRETVPTLNKNEELTILLLSDETADDDMVDAKVIDTLLYLKKTLDRDNIHLIVELLDPKNDSLIKDLNIDNTIISNKIISLLLGKLALFPRTEAFYDDLLTLCPHRNDTDDKALLIQDAGLLLDEKLPMDFRNAKTFINAFYQASNQKLMPIGIIRSDEVNLFHGGLHEETLQIAPTDLLIIYKV